MTAPRLPSLHDSRTGLVTRLLEPELDRGDPDVFIAVALHADYAVYGLSTAANLSGSGAGLTRGAARGAAIGETAERYACSLGDPEEIIVGSHAELSRRGMDPVPPEDFALFAPEQQISTPRFSRDTRIAWVRADSLTRRTERLVPACLLFMGGRETLFADGAVPIAPAISTGAACAASRGEALLKGMLEVIERDAFVITWRNALPRPRVRIDPRSALHATFTERFARPGIEYTLYATTLDIPIPSFFGVLRDLRRDPPGVIVGGAAHPDPVRAAQKTLLELAQGLKWLDHLAREGKTFEPAPDFSNVKGFDDRTSLYAFRDMREAFAFLDRSPDVVDLSAIRPAFGGEARFLVRDTLELFRARGLEVLGVDLTPVDVAACGLSVIKAIVPGCEPMEGDHTEPFLGGSRWREVPVELGLRARKPSLDERNPYPHPYP